MSARPPASGIFDFFDRKFRPKAAARSAKPAVVGWGPAALARGAEPVRVEWIVSPTQRIEQLYRRRAELMRRLADDEGARADYERVVQELLSLQRAELERTEAQRAQEDAQLRATESLIESNERFLERHAHHLPST